MIKSYFEQKKDPIDKLSISVLRKQSIASLGEFTIGIPLTLNEVLRSNGTFDFI